VSMHATLTLTVLVLAVAGLGGREGPCHTLRSPGGTGCDHVQDVGPSIDALGHAGPFRSPIGRLG
jgi:hypothetical protein